MLPLLGRCPIARILKAEREPPLAATGTSVVDVWAGSSGGADAGMLRRLTEVVRWRTARVLVGLYVACLLAPPAEIAFGTVAPPCLTDDSHGVVRTAMHEHGGKVHVHKDGTVHEHSKAADRHTKDSDGQCCGLFCASALPAVLIDVPLPALLAKSAISAEVQGLAGRTPDRLDRPPISSLSL